MYCSTMDVAAGPDNIYNGTEETCDTAYDNHFPVYGKTKIEAEKIVLEANGEFCIGAYFLNLALVGTIDDTSVFSGYLTK